MRPLLAICILGALLMVLSSTSAGGPGKKKDLNDIWKKMRKTSGKKPAGSGAKPSVRKGPSKDANKEGQPKDFPDCKKYDSCVADMGKYDCFRELYCPPKRKEYCSKLDTPEGKKWPSFVQIYCTILAMPRYGYEIDIEQAGNWPPLTPEEKKAMEEKFPNNDEATWAAYLKIDGPPNGKPSKYGMDNQ